MLTAFLTVKYLQCSMNKNTTQYHNIFMYKIE